MRILLILMTLFISGCDQDITEIPSRQLDWAVDVCKNNGGILKINPVGNRDMLYSYCVNGAEFEYSKDKKEKE